MGQTLKSSELNFLYPLPLFSSDSVSSVPHTASQPESTRIRRMLHNRSTSTPLANSTLIQPAKLSYGITSSADPPGLYSYMAIVISTVLLPGILGYAVMGMSYPLLFEKCLKGRSSMQMVSRS